MYLFCDGTRDHTASSSSNYLKIGSKILTNLELGLKPKKTEDVLTRDAATGRATQAITEGPKLKGAPRDG